MNLTIFNDFDEINIKLLLIGDGGVGKTSLFNAFFQRDIPIRYIPTLGNNIEKKKYFLENKNISVSINIWDIGGQKSLNIPNPATYKNVDAAFLVFDLSKPEESLTEINDVYLENLKKNTEDCKTILIGNKMDLILVKKDLKNILENFFSSDIPLLLTSAKTGENVSEIFEALIFNFLKDWEEKFTDKKFEDISKEFLKKIDKTEDKLNELFVSLDSIDAYIKQKEKSTHISKKVLSTSEKTESDKSKFISIEQDIKKIELVRSEIVKLFESKLNEFDNLITDLMSMPNDKLAEYFDKAKEKINVMRDEFKSNLNEIIEIYKRKMTK